MELTFAQQSTAFLCSLVFGAAAGLLYDIFKIIRMTLCKGKASVFVTDFLYVFIVSLNLFIFFNFLRNFHTDTLRKTNHRTIKEITPKKRKKGRYILIYLAIIGFVFYAVITIINQNVQIAEKKAELTDLQQQISVVEIQSQYLKKVQNYKGDDLKKYIEKIAKDELVYVGDGERIFINVAGE